MRIFLVRHGQSAANNDWKVNEEMADHAIPLTAEGHEQARKCGAFLADYFRDHVAMMGVNPLLSPTIMVKVPKIRLWHSPYLRTRQTTEGILETCRLEDLSKDTRFLGAPGDVQWCGEEFGPKGHRLVLPPGSPWIMDHQPHLLLSEQQFGIFDGLSDEEREAKYPDYHAHYEKCKRFGGKMYAKMPLGESRYDVCVRVHQAFGSFIRDKDKHGIENLVIVGHGTTNRAFMMMWMHHEPEWMETEPNPKNCSVRLIEKVHGKYEDKGYIFAGFENPPGYKHKANHETEE